VAAAAPVTGTFHSPVNTLSCRAIGDPGDSATNRRKNRTDVTQSYHATTFNAVADLAYPATKSKDRSLWPPESLAVIQGVEGAAVQVVGYLVICFFVGWLYAQSARKLQQRSDSLAAAVER